MLRNCQHVHSGLTPRAFLTPACRPHPWVWVLLCLTAPLLQILTQEDWNVVLYNGMASTSSWAALYFVALMTFGNYVLFNLLVAILVEGFQAEVRGTSRGWESGTLGRTSAQTDMLWPRPSPTSFTGPYVMLASMPAQPSCGELHRGVLGTNGSHSRRASSVPSALWGTG